MELPGTVPLLTEFSMVLLECRRRGMEFEDAWAYAMKVVKIERENMDQMTKQEMKDWRKALVWGKEHFEASYRSRERADDDVARPSLSDVHTAAQRAGIRAFSA